MSSRFDPHCKFFSCIDCLEKKFKNISSEREENEKLITILESHPLFSEAVTSINKLLRNFNERIEFLEDK